MINERSSDLINNLDIDEESELVRLFEKTMKYIYYFPNSQFYLNDYI